MMLDQQLLEAPSIDVDGLDLDGAARVTYVLAQSFRYDYPSPVEQLRHRLVVLPPQRHGDQHLRAHRLDVAGAPARRTTRRDSRGNHVTRLHADTVATSIDLRLGALVERVSGDGPVVLPASALTDPRLLRPTRLTAADAALREMASRLRRDPAQVCAAVHEAMTYEYGVTSVWSTAAEALSLGRGVCQDSAHIMLALCHLLGLPARYVSGHLIGQGGTHAWVEVVVPQGDHAIALPFDPCNGRAATARYLTVATGRDYADVPPTSGTYVGAAGGQLTTDRRLAVLNVA